MTKKTKNWLVLGVSFLIIGVIVFGGAMTMLKWDFKKFSTVKYQTNVYEITEEFRGVSIEALNADIDFILSSDGKVSVSCYEMEKVKHDVSVVDGTLCIKSVDNRKWYNYIDFGFSSPKITVSIPIGAHEMGALNIRGRTGDICIPSEFKFESAEILVSTGDVRFLASTIGLIKIEASTGDITIENIDAGAIDLTVSTGNIRAKNVAVAEDVSACVSTGKTYLKDVTCRNLKSSGNTGDIELESVIASGKFEIERSTGDVELEKCDASEIKIITSTGDVEASFLTDKIVFAKTGTGSVNVPNKTNGGPCEITTKTGDIEINIAEK